jgi:hypothetical protein
MPDEKPTGLTAKTKAELAEIFRRQDAGEFKLISLLYGQGRPGKPFAQVGVIWKEEKQESLDL